MHAPGQLSGKVTLSRDTETDALLTSLYEGRNGGPRHILGHIYSRFIVYSILDCDFKLRYYTLLINTELKGSLLHFK